MPLMPLLGEGGGGSLSAQTRVADVSGPFLINECLWRARTCITRCRTVPGLSVTMPWLLQTGKQLRARG